MAKFCSCCGKPIAQGAKFCADCGAPIGNAPQNTATQQSNTPQQTYSQPTQNAAQQSNVPLQPYPYSTPQQNYPMPTAQGTAPKAKAPGWKRALTVLFVLADIALVIACIKVIPDRMEQGAFLYIPKVLNGIEPDDEESNESEDITVVEPDNFFGFWDTEPLDDERNNSSRENSPNNNDTYSPDLSSYTTSELPEFDDFDWYIDTDYTEFLSHGEVITDFENVSGGWKAMFYIDPDNNYDSCGVETVNAVISGSSNNAVLTVKWYELYLADGSIYDETDYADSEFNGSMSSGKLTLDGDAKIKINGFYLLDNKEYAVGTVELQDGTPTFFAMVRP